MLKYFRESIKRKIARRITKEYPPKVEQIEVEGYGKIDFANWTNPLVPHCSLTAEMIGFFKQFINEGDLVIDIGANIGDTTVPMALCAGATGLTLAFDPNPLVFKILEKNASLNPGMQNIEPLRFAISKEEESFYFVSSEASFGNGGISVTKESPHGKFVYPEKILGINLHHLLESKYSDRVLRLSFIKIDTEGYDKEIIKSIHDLIIKCKPVIVAESFGDASDSDKKELFDVIHKCGYEIFYFEDFNINAPVIKLNENTDMLRWSYTVNIYAKPL